MPLSKRIALNLILSSSSVILTRCTRIARMDFYNRLVNSLHDWGVIASRRGVFDFGVGAAREVGRHTI